MRNNYKFCDLWSPYDGMVSSVDIYHIELEELSAEIGLGPNSNGQSYLPKWCGWQVGDDVVERC